MAKKKILVVDDEEHIVKLMESRLKANGYDVITAHDGREGVRKAREALPNVILMDIMMPNLTGGEAVKQLKDDPLTRDIPVIFLTAMLTKEEEKNFKSGIEVDLSHYPAIAKPFDPEDLLDKIQKAIAD